MQRHSGTLPARKYGPRKKGSGASRAAAVAAAASSSSAQFQASTSNESPREARTVHLKSTDEDESSSVEHSLDNAIQQEMMSPSSVEVALKQQQHLQQHREQQESNQSSSGHHGHHNQSHQQNSQRSPVTPIAVPFNASRFYGSSSSISAPIAHTWLTAAGSIASKGRAVISQNYDSFLTSYGFTQHHPSHLTRLTLLPGQVLDQQDKRDSSQQDYHGQNQGQPNPDFSQLLD
jgi:hypothetical protein